MSSLSPVNASPGQAAAPEAPVSQASPGGFWSPRKVAILTVGGAIVGGAVGAALIASGVVVVALPIIAAIAWAASCGIITGGTVGLGIGLAISVEQQFAPKKEENPLSGDPQHPPFFGGEDEEPVSAFSSPSSSNSSSPVGPHHPQSDSDSRGSSPVVRRHSNSSEGSLIEDSPERYSPYTCSSSSDSSSACSSNSGDVLAPEPPMEEYQIPKGYIGKYNEEPSAEELTFFINEFLKRQGRAPTLCEVLMIKEIYKNQCHTIENFSAAVVKIAQRTEQRIAEHCETVTERIPTKQEINNMVAANYRKDEANTKWFEQFFSKQENVTPRLPTPLPKASLIPIVKTSRTEEEERNYRSAMNLARHEMLKRLEART